MSTTRHSYPFSYSQHPSLLSPQFSISHLSTLQYRTSPLNLHPYKSPKPPAHHQHPHNPPHPQSTCPLHSPAPCRKNSANNTTTPSVPVSASPPCTKYSLALYLSIYLSIHNSPSTTLQPNSAPPTSNLHRCKLGIYQKARIHGV